MAKLQYEIDIDTDELLKKIKEADKLDDNPAFLELASVLNAKKLVWDALEQIDAVEQEVKRTISAKAKALYGDEWAVIKGDNYKITRSFAGAVYEIDGNPRKDFVITKKTVNATAVKDWAETHDGLLPKGIVPNGSRSEQLRITIK